MLRSTITKLTLHENLNDPTDQAEILIVTATTCDGYKLPNTGWIYYYNHIYFGMFRKNKNGNTRKIQVNYVKYTYKCVQSSQEY